MKQIHTPTKIIRITMLLVAIAFIMLLISRVSFAAPPTTPTVLNVSSTTADGSYTTDDTIAVTVTFSEIVTVTGIPRIQLETGINDRYANYVSGSGTTTLTFNYIVQPGDTSDNLDYLATNSLELNGGTIEGSDNSADLTLPTPEAAGLLTTSTLNPIEDAYIRGGGAASNNYGAETNLIYRNNGFGSSNTYRSYLKFDLSSISEPISSAKIRLFVYSSSSITANVCEQTDDTWTELGITGNNASPPGNVIDSFSANSTWQWVEVDVTTYCSNELAGDKIASLMLNPIEDVLGYAESREATNKPELVISINKNIVIDTTGPAAPSASTAGGTYNAQQNVTLTPAGDAVSTYYTLDGTVPDNTKTSYSGAIAIDGANGTTVTLKAVSYDALGNIGPVLTQNYVFDKAGPVAPTASPAGAAYSLVQSAILTVAGDAANTYYTLDGSAPDNTKTAYSGAIAIDGANGVTVVLKAVSYDSLGNIGSVMTENYTFDKAGPTGTITINGGDVATGSTTVALSVYAEDPSGVDQMIISNYPDFSMASWESYNTTRGWSLTNGDDIKTVYIKYKDTLGNESAVYSDNIILDTSDPTGTISINNGASTTDNLTVVLSVYAQKEESVAISVYESIYGSIDNNITHMLISNYPDFAGASWEPYSDTKNWTLTAGDGTKTVYIRFADSLGNESQAYSDSIILDTANPTGSININNGAGTTSSKDVILNISATDANGVGQMMISNYPDLEGAGWETYAPTKPWTLFSGNGEKTVYIKFRDNIGKESIIYSDTIILNIPLPPAPPADTEGPTEPQANPAGGTYSTAQTVTLIRASDAMNTYYTIDGTEPDKTDRLYTGPITIDGQDGASITLKAVSYDSAGNRGDVLVEIYIFDKQGPKIPEISPEEGTYNTALSITITPANDAVSTYYTLDGTEPGKTKIFYTGPITIDGENGEEITLKAVSYDERGNKGTVMIQTYRFEKQEILPPVPPAEPQLPEQTVQPTEPVDPNMLTEPAGQQQLNKTEQEMYQTNTTQQNDTSGPQDIYYPVTSDNSNAGQDSQSTNASSDISYALPSTALSGTQVRLNSKEIEEKYRQIRMAQEEKENLRTKVSAAAVAGAAALGVTAAGAIAIGTGAIGAAAAGTAAGAITLGAGAAGAAVGGGTAGTATAGVSAAGTVGKGVSALADVARQILGLTRRILKYRRRIYVSYRRVERLKRGISSDAYKIEDSDIIRIKNLGFSFIKLDVNLEMLYNRQYPSLIDHVRLNKIDQIVGKILGQRLSVILKLKLDQNFIQKTKKDNPFSDAAVRFCEAIAKFLSSKKTNRLFVEMPYIPYISEKYIRAMRRNDQNHTIVLDGMQVGVLEDIPEQNNKNMIYNISVSTTDLNIPLLRQELKMIHKWSEKNKIPVVATITGKEDKIRFKKLRILLKRYTIGWNVDYSLLSEKEILKALRLKKLKNQINKY